MSARIPMIRRDADGTITDGTCVYERRRWFDFRDLDGRPLVLPPGAAFEINTRYCELSEEPNP